jgi:hypothetical protein
MIDGRERSLSEFSNFKVHLINSKAAAKGVASNAAQPGMEL